MIERVLVSTIRLVGTPVGVHVPTPRRLGEDRVLDAWRRQGFLDGQKRLTEAGRAFCYEDRP